MLDSVEITKYLKTVPDNTKLYLGCDSSRSKDSEGNWWAEYAVVLVVHKGGNKGCKIFGEIFKERDYDKKASRPSFRLMNEVYKVAEFYLNNFEMFEEFETEIHIDINPNLKYGSSCVISQAIGYIKGTCGFEPKVKPEAFGASYAADRFKSIS